MSRKHEHIHAHMCMLAYIVRNSQVPKDHIKF